MGAPARRRGDFAWNGKHFSAKVAGVAGGDQRAAALRRLHDDDAERQPGQGPVAGRKVPAERGHPWGKLGHHRAMRLDLAGQAAVLGGIHDIDPAAEDDPGTVRPVCSLSFRRLRLPGCIARYWRNASNAVLDSLSSWCHTASAGSMSSPS